MKNILILILCAAVVAVFFACSNESFDIRPVNPPDTNVLCEWNNEGEPYSCLSVNREVCVATGGTPLDHPGQICLPPHSSSSIYNVSSSSSDGISSSSSSVVQSSSSFVMSSSSSSSVIAISSSSSLVPSSSSGPPLPNPVTSGKFEFRWFDSSSSGKGAYYVGVSNIRTSTNEEGTVEHSGKLLHLLTITNVAEAQCEPIMIEVTLNGTILDLPQSTGGADIYEAGELIATASAICGGTKKILKTAEAVVILPPVSQTGKFEFRWFDDNTSGTGRNYFVGTNNMRESKSDPGTYEYSGKLLNTLSVYGCTIIVETTLGGTPIVLPTDSETNVTVDRTGPLIATAYAMCGTVKEKLKETTAEVINAP